MGGGYIPGAHAPARMPPLGVARGPSARHPVRRLRQVERDASLFALTPIHVRVTHQHGRDHRPAAFLEVSSTGPRIRCGVDEYLWTRFQAERAVAIAVLSPCWAVRRRTVDRPAAAVGDRPDTPVAAHGDAHAHVRGVARIAALAGSAR